MNAINNLKNRKQRLKRRIIEHRRSDTMAERLLNHADMDRLLNQFKPKPAPKHKLYKRGLPNS